MFLGENLDNMKIFTYLCSINQKRMCDEKTIYYAADNFSNSGYSNGTDSPR